MITLLAFAAAATTQPACNTNGNQQELNACAAQSFQRADRELNRVWAEVIAEARQSDQQVNRSYDSRPPSEQVLREAQRAWILYRDASCTYEGMAEARGGSMEPMVYAACRARLTEQRTRDLRGDGGQ